MLHEGRRYPLLAVAAASRLEPVQEGLDTEPTVSLLAFLTLVPITALAETSPCALKSPGDVELVLSARLSAIVWSATVHCPECQQPYEPMSI